MFLLKNKLSPALKYSIANSRFKTYRVLIGCRNLTESVANKLKTSKDALIYSLNSINSICAYLSPNSILRLAELPEVNFMTFDNFAYSSTFSSSSQKSMTLKLTSKYTGKNICIGIVDSGVFPHPDLFFNKKAISKFLDLVNCMSHPYDDNGTGTFLTGIIRGNGKTFKGIAPNCSIYSIKVFNSLGKAYISDIFKAIEQLIKDSLEFNIKIICLPFEISTEDTFILSTFDKLFRKAVELGIIIVVPTGSAMTEKDSIRSFATLSSCLTIAGIDATSNPKIYKYSSCGPCSNFYKPDFSAPCVNICSLNSDKLYISERDGLKLYPNKLTSPYTSFTGTGASAAYVCGICALLFEKDNSLSFKDISSLLKSSCTMLNCPKWQQGEGVLDISKLNLN